VVSESVPLGAGKGKKQCSNKGERQRTEHTPPVYPWVLANVNETHGLQSGGYGEHKKCSTRRVDDWE